MLTIAREYPIHRYSIGTSEASSGREASERAPGARLRPTETLVVVAVWKLAQQLKWKTLPGECSTHSAVAVETDFSPTYVG